MYLERNERIISLEDVSEDKRCEIIDDLMKLIGMVIVQVDDYRDEKLARESAANYKGSIVTHVREVLPATSSNEVRG